MIPRYLFMLILLQASLLASAWADDTCKPDRAAVNAMAADLSTRVRSTKTPMMVFNYTSHDRRLAGIDDPNDPRVLTHLQHIVAELGSVSGSPSHTTYADGLYVALDPSVSDSHGGDNPALFAIKLPAGFPYLEPAFNETYRPGTLKTLTNVGCGFNPVRGSFQRNPNFIHSGISLLLKNRNCQCGAIAKAVLAKLKVDAITFPFHAEACGGADASAMILTNTSMISKNSVEALFRTIPKRDPYAEDRAAINALTNLWPDAPHADEKSLAEWERKNLKNCQTKSVEAILRESEANQAAAGQ